MKKTLLFFAVTFLFLDSLRSQCVPTCSNYIVNPTTFTVYPSAGTNAVPLFSPNMDDGYTPPVQLGFNFNFYCTTYSTVLIYTNGLLQFDIGAPSTFPFGFDGAQFIPNPSLPTVLNGIVAFRMDDLDPGVGGTITYTTLGVSPNKMFVLTYSDVPIYGQATLLNSGQIVLHETTNLIDIITINSAQSPTLATQGIEDATGTLGLAVPGRNQSSWSATNSAYRFSQYFAPLPPSSVTGNTLLCQGSAGSYQTNTITGATYSWTVPFGWSGNNTASAFTATAGASGNLSVTATYTCGTSAPATINVSVTPAPVVSITSATPALICSGKTVTFNTSGAVSYTLEPGGITGVPAFTDTPLVTTVYSLSGTNAQGCVSFNTSTITITVYDTPTVAVNSGTVCLGQSFTISPSGASNYVVTGNFFNVTPTVGLYSYSVVGTGTNGCISKPSVSSLTVYSLPAISAIASRTTICLKESTVLTATGSLSYLWSNASVNSSLTITPTTNTFYTVTGTDIRGCKNTATVNIQVKPCTGIEELPGNEVDASLYPNPTNGSFTIRVNNFNDQSYVEIYNAIGQMVVTEKLKSETTEINLKGLSDGLYYVKVKNTAREKTIRVIKQ